MGCALLEITESGGDWSVKKLWKNRNMQCKFTSPAYFQGHVYGLHNNHLVCLDAQTGERKWTGSEYGNGQLLLLADQDLLLVSSEEGELALVGATPDQFRELARFPAIEGKTWNHPVLAGDVLLVRNGEEMAAFRLSLADR